MRSAIRGGQQRYLRIGGGAGAFARFSPRDGGSAPAEATLDRVTGSAPGPKPRAGSLRSSAMSLGCRSD